MNEIRHMKNIPITHIINSLTFGGAEAMLCNLVKHCDRERFPTKVVTLIDDHSLAGQLQKLDVPIISMGMKPGIPDPRRAASLAAYLYREPPGVVHTWMDHSNFIGGLATRIATRSPVVWGIHHVNHGPGLSKPTTRLIVSACAKMSGWLPSTIICCSEASRREYTRMGFSPSKLRFIPNGFDSVAFAPDPLSRASVRAELGIDHNTILVGIAARFDPFKDHANFLNAAAIVSRSQPNTRFLLCGKGVDTQNESLMSLIRQLGIEAKCQLIGPRRDMPRIFAALDIATSSSLSEAFPLAVGEAMATGVPCVATDVGDTAQLVGQTGRVVPSRSSAALANGLLDLITLEPDERQKLGKAARERVRTHFELSVISRQYERVYESMISNANVAPSSNQALLASVQESS